MAETTTNLVAQHAPADLAELITNVKPYVVSTGSKVDVAVEHEYKAEFDVLRWTVSLSNDGTKETDSIQVVPLRLELAIDPAITLPRVRHLSGSYHFDGCYPSRAFRVLEEAFMTHDHCKPVVMGGRNAGDHVPILQFAVERETGLSGFFAAVEWSGEWQVTTGWEKYSWQGEERGSFVIEWSISLGDLQLAPGETVTIPAVHIGFFEGETWGVLDNLQRHYIREALSPPIGEHRLPLPVSYNHWFGLYTWFDVELLKAQASRAAEIGCEYFCLDAAWYKTGENFLAGLGNWNTPDPGRFPRGEDDVRELSTHVRNLGMGFGLWHLIQAAVEGSDAVRKHPELFREHAIGSVMNGPQDYRLKLETDAGVDYAVQTIGRWVREWNLTWTRFEAIPENGLRYNQGFNRVIDTLRKQYPNLYIEICNGGGQRLDFNSVVRTHGNWLSDHTSDPEVCRFMQTGALRFWPANYLNMAITAFRGRGGESATAHQLLSRMVGVMSFSGAIAEWTPEQTELARQFVQVYKQTRSLKDQPVFFPLPQPRSVDDWDAVVFGGSSGPGQLLFVYRVHGKETVRFPVPEAEGEWELLLASGKAKLEVDGQQVVVTLPVRSGALWRLSPS